MGWPSSSMRADSCNGALAGAAACAGAARPGQARPICPRRRARVTMVKAWFEVLCRNEDDKEACARLKALMHGCKVSDAEPTAAYDHVGERDFGDEGGAIARMDELIRLAGEDALDISVRIKHRG